MLRRIIVFTLILMMLVAAPVWANAAAVQDLPRTDAPVTMGSSPDDFTWTR